MFAVVGKQDSTCFHLNPPLLSITKFQSLDTAICQCVHKVGLELVTATNEQKPSSEKGKEEKGKRKAIEKYFVSCVNAKKVENNDIFFLCKGFYSQTLTTHRTVKEGRGLSFIPLYYSTHSWTLRHLPATLHLRRLSDVFNCTACIYQTATRWDLPLYQFTIWLVDDTRLIFVCLLDDLIQGFVTVILH